MKTFDVQNYSGVAQMLAVVPKWRQILVKLQLDEGLLSEYVRGFSEEVRMRAEPTSSVLGIEDEGKLQKRILKYMKAIIWLRVKYCNRVRIPLRPKDTGIVVPGVLHSFISGVGRIDSAEYGFTIDPEIDGEFGYSTSEFLTEARWMKTICDATGIAYSEGMPTDPTGYLPLMCLQVQNGAVWGESNHSEQIFGLIAAIFGLIPQRNVLRTVVPADPDDPQSTPTEEETLTPPDLTARVHYGDLKDLAVHAQRLVSHEKHG